MSHSFIEMASTHSTDEVSNQGAILDRQEKLKPILKVSETAVRSSKQEKRVGFVNCDKEDSDDDFEIEFSDKCREVEILVNKISALTFSQIGQQAAGQKYVLNSHQR